MAKYHKILLAVDFAADNVTIIDKASEVVAENGAELYLIHAHEPVVTAYQAGGMGAWNAQAVSLDDEIRKLEEKKMTELALSLDVPADHCLLPWGKASNEIRVAAEQLHIDLIVIGTHGRHGLALILGSTANGVLHGAPCDVLAVRTR